MQGLYFDIRLMLASRYAARTCPLPLTTSTAEKHRGVVPTRTRPLPITASTTASDQYTSWKLRRSSPRTYSIPVTASTAKERRAFATTRPPSSPTYTANPSRSSTRPAN